MAVEYNYYTLEIEPQSDDHITAELKAHRDNLYSPNGFSVDTLWSTQIDGTKESFEINNEFKIDMKFGSGGWHTSIVVLDEDKLKESWKAYEMKLQPNDGFYGFSVVLKSFVPIIIDGFYGDKKSEILSIMEDWIEPGDAKKIYEKIEGYLK